LQFAKAFSAATLSQQEKNNTADVQRGRLYVNSFELIFVAMYFRRVRVAGRSFVAAPMDISTFQPVF